MKTYKTFGAFLRRNAVYLVLALCILAIGIATTFMLVNRIEETNTQLNGGSTNVEQPSGSVDNPGLPSEPDEPVDNPSTPTEPDTPVAKPEQIVFDMPVLEATSIVYYSETMVFNSTLGRYSAHKAIDFYAPENANVYCVYDGVVKSVESSLIHGVTIVVEHANGLETVYNSLVDGDLVTVGSTVKKGDIIGNVSTTNRQEYKDGAHLHFEVRENGVVIDPAKYLELQEK